MTSNHVYIGIATVQCSRRFPSGVVHGAKSPSVLRAHASTPVNCTAPPHRIRSRSIAFMIVC
ncbi:MAG: hypothetical protein E6G46_06155, partial [Actinobacteria bacterium]